MRVNYDHEQRSSIEIEKLNKEIKLLRELVIEARPWVKKYRQTNSDLVVSETNRIFDWLKRNEKSLINSGVLNDNPK